MNPRLWIDYARRAGADPEAYDRGAYQRRLREWSGRTGIRLVDPLEEFVARSVDNELYYPVDGHWNPAGHALAAELILDGLLPGKGLATEARERVAFEGRARGVGKDGVPGGPHGPHGPSSQTLGQPPPALRSPPGTR
jgi:hypothetical protein